MVTYTEWTRAVHTAYKDMGGTYDGEDAAAQLTQMAAKFWQENKEQLKELAFQAAVQVARRALNV